MIAIAVTLYNSDYIERTIQSIKLQKEQNWKCYITNDLSTNNCVDVARKAIDKDDRFVLIHNDKKMWQTGNYYQICQSNDLKPNDICVELDGDDWFSDGDVLTRVNKYYEDFDLWLTYGSFVYWNKGDHKPGFAQPPVGGIHQQRVTHAFTTSHLRTWRVGLFRQLALADICEDDGKTFIPVSGDLYFFQCMLEMAGEEHSKFISDVNYVYNDNDLSEHIVSMDKVIHYTNMAKVRKPKDAIINKYTFLEPITRP